MRGTSRYVDYQRVARRYQAGRTIPDAVLDRWGAAVRPHLPERPLRVADVGAGTGIFRCCVTPVVGRDGGGDRAVGGDDPGGWGSTALHHFFDMGRAIAELGRVLGDDGRVVVRTLARCLGVDDLVALFGPRGFVLSHVEEVVEGTSSFAETAEWR